jgi:medium-chain acyl-[acyl-carrier-protein] hydrolase
VQVAAVHLPGRLDRFRERPLSRPDEAADRLAEAVAEIAGLPLLIFGDCMGSLLAFELVRRLRRSGIGTVRALIVASYPPPELPRRERMFHDADPADLRARIGEVGGVAPEVLHSDELFELLLPMLRADFALFETYRYRPGPPLDVDLHAVVGADDPWVSRELISGWGRHTTGRFTAAPYPGGHFFLQNHDVVPAMLADTVLDAEGAA